MKYSSSLFNIDSHSPISIQVQIREQIKWLIGKGLLKSGDLLPSTNQLATHLSVNRNTIQSVYSQLKKDGLLITKRGSGTQVASRKEVERFKAQNPYFSLIESTIENADKEGYNTENMLLAGLAYTQLAEQIKKQKKRYLFIECKKSACVFYLNKIKELTTAAIDEIDVSSSKEDLLDSIQKADVIITRTDLAERVSEFINNDQKKIVSVGDTNDVSLLFEMLDS